MPEDQNTPHILSLNSRRKYEICVIESKALNIYKMTLGELLADDGTELNYSLQDDIDLILDLGVFDSMPIKTNRDDQNAHGIIMRVK
jgi:hypothetical protein